MEAFLVSTQTRATWKVSASGTDCGEKTAAVHSTSLACQNTVTLLREGAQGSTMEYDTLTQQLWKLVHLADGLRRVLERNEELEAENETLRNRAKEWEDIAMSGEAARQKLILDFITKMK